MADRKPLLMNKEFYNLLNSGAKKQEPKDVFTSETPEKMLKTLQGIFCKGRYQSWIMSPKVSHSKNFKKQRKNHG